MISELVLPSSIKLTNERTCAIFRILFIVNLVVNLYTGYSRQPIKEKLQRRCASCDCALLMVAKENRQVAHRWYLGGIASAGAACGTHPLDLLKVSDHVVLMDRFMVLINRSICKLNR